MMRFIETDKKLNLVQYRKTIETVQKHKINAKLNSDMSKNVN